MQSFLNTISIKTKILILIAIPFLGFIFMSVMYFSKVENFSTIEIVVPIVFFILTILFSYCIQKNILDAISKIKGGMERFFNYLTSTEKHLDLIDLDSSDDLGVMAKELNTNITKIKDGLAHDNEVINEAKFVSKMVGKGFLVYRINSEADNVYINELRDTVNDMIDNLRVNIVTSFQTSLQYANRDFTTKAQKSEVGGIVNTLLRCLNMIGINISEFLAMVNQNGKLLDSKSNELLEYVNTLHTSTLNQASSLEQTAAAINEITNSISDTSNKATTMSDISNKTKGYASSGIELVTDTQNSMSEISESTKAISEAITVIDQIAFQTNILSLNAAVEAATAGEAGKGFAVVAQEVRNLAGRSAEAAKEIKDLVENANEKADEGAKLSQKMYESFNELNKSIEENTVLIDDVANSNKNQMLSLTQINEAMNNLDAITQENASIASQTKDVAIQTNNVASEMIKAAANNEYSPEVEKRIGDFSFTQELNNLKIEFAKSKQAILNQVNNNSSSIDLNSEHKTNIDGFIKEHEANSFSTADEWARFKTYYGELQNQFISYGEGMKARDDEKTLISSENIEKTLDEVFILINKFKEQ